MAKKALTTGKSFLATVSSVLWYIDGHEETLSSRGCLIPERFRSFHGYNLPEISMHRKRTHTKSLSCDQLATHAATLYYALLLSWMSTTKWKEIKDAYLKDQAKKMREHHSSDDLPVAEKISIALLPTNSNPHRTLKKISSEVVSRRPYEMVTVGDYTPVDRKNRYMYIQLLRSGLSKPCVLCTYSN